MMGLLLLEGGEAGSLFATGWFRPGAGIMATSYTTSAGVGPRQDLNTNGGAYFWGNTSITTMEYSHELLRTAREVWIRIAIVRTGSNGQPIHVALDNSTGANQVNLHQFASATLNVRRDTTTLGSSPPDGLPVDTAWRVYHIRAFIDNTLGEVEIFKDLDFVTPIVSVTGVDTQNGADDFIQFIRQFSIASVYDDLVVTDATVAFSTTAGTLTPGDTITGNNSGTTALVTSIVSGSGAGQGIAQVHFVRVNGTDAWNDPSIDPWATDTQLSNGATWTANVLAPLSTFKDENSGPEPDGLIFGLSPSTDVVGSTQLVRVGVDTGTNAGQVNAVPGDDATALQSGVQTSTPGERDMYELEDTSVAGFGVGDILSIHGVAVSAYWQRDGAGLNNGNIVVEDLSVEYDGGDFALPVSSGGDVRLLNSVPDGSEVGIPWTETKVNSLRVGIKFKG